MKKLDYNLQMKDPKELGSTIFLLNS